MACSALNITGNVDKDVITKRYQEAHFAKDDGELKDLDLKMKDQTDAIQNAVAKYVLI